MQSFFISSSKHIGVHQSDDDIGNKAQATTLFYNFTVSLYCQPWYDKPCSNDSWYEPPLTRNVNQRYQIALKLVIVPSRVDHVKW